MIDAPSPAAARCVLFANVAGNARLHEKLGSAETARAVDRCLKRMERAVTAFGGRIVKTAGNELSAVFDLANEAYYAALEMQQRVGDLPPVSGVELAVRVGFSHGSLSEADGNLRGPAVEQALYLTGLAKPGQTLTSSQARATLSLVLKKSTRNLGPASASGKAQGMNVFEAMPPDAAALATLAAGASGAAATGDERVGALRLRYADTVTTLDEHKKEIRIGRDADSDIVIHDRRASRQHATIARRRDRFVLIDNSTNGTYVTVASRPELLVRREECVLRERGRLCFAAPGSNADADCADFELI
ncbi:MAG: adenylate/guanylate cyclase domain-containing protein [Propionivibrio sp.]